MSNFVEAVGAILRDRTCNLLSNPLIDGRQWGGRSPYVGEGVATNPLTRRWYNNTIDGLKRIFCDDPTPTDEEDLFPVPPFQGGQCEGVNYSFTIGGFYTSPEGNVPVSVEADCSQPSLDNGPGPISLEQNVPGQFNTIRARIRFGDNRTRVFLTTTAGTTQHFLTGMAVRCDGLPDDCGGIGPSPYQPTNIFNFTENITYIDNSETSITELGDFNLFAPIFLPGSIQIPFTLDVGGVNFSGTLNADGTFNISPSFNFDFGSDNDPSPIVEPELPEDPEFDIEPSEDQESRIVGAWVVLTDDPTQATQIFEGGVTHFYPRAGLLKFRMAVGNAGFSYSAGIDVKTRRAYIPVPSTGRAIGADWFGYYGTPADVTLAYARLPVNLLPPPD